MRHVTFGFAVAVALLSSCATSFGKKIDDSQLAHFRNGVTTLQDVEASLGPPQASERQPGGGMTLEYWQTSIQSSKYSRLPFLGRTGHVVTSSDRVTFDFDLQGKLMDYNRSQMQMDSRDLKPVPASS